MSLRVRARVSASPGTCLCESGRTSLRVRGSWDLSQGFCSVKTHVSASPAILGLAEPRVLFSKNPYSVKTHVSASPGILGLAEPRVLAPLALRVLTFSRKTLNLAVDFKILCFCESGRVSLRVRARVSASPGACLCKSGRMSLRVRARVSASPGTCQCQSEAVSSSLLSVIVIEHEN